MASNRGYTTATKVRDALGGRVITYLTDAMIEAAINRAEAKIDALGEYYDLTWTTGKSRHWLLEEAATYGAAFEIGAVCGPSMNTLDELWIMLNNFIYKWKAAMDMLQNQEYGSNVVNA